MSLPIHPSPSLGLNFSDGDARFSKKDARRKDHVNGFEQFGSIWRTLPKRRGRNLSSPPRNLDTRDKIYVKSSSGVSSDVGGSVTDGGV
jgi:hypothetical protein